MQTSPDLSQPVTKTVYAAMRRVSPSRISQYIAERKIFGDAIVGEGRKAQIIPSVANQQLGDTLDFDQVLANGKPIAVADPPAPAPPSPQDLPTLMLNSDQRRAAKAKADSAEIRAEQDRRSMAEQTGRFTLTDEAANAFRKQLGEVFGGFENATPDLAKQLCDETGFADHRLMTVALRKVHRAWRAKLAEKARSASFGLPACVPDPEQPAYEGATEGAAETEAPSETE